MSQAVTTITNGKIRLDYDAYLALPEDGKLYEIIDGDLFVNPAPTPRHQSVSKNLEWHLINALERSGLGIVFDAPIDVVLDNENIVQPDILFIRKENRAIIGEKHIKGAPDLIIEILSPASRRKDVLIKALLYARFGVPHYWIADPDLDRIECFRLQAGAYKASGLFKAPDTLSHADFPGLNIPLAEVFA